MTADPNPPPLGRGQILLRLGAIGAIVLIVVAIFAWAGGLFSPHRVTQRTLIDTFEQLNGEHAGFRRNHAKGICFAGTFESNGAGAQLSKASVFASGRVPVIGRFALAGGQPYAADASRTVRSMAVLFSLPDGEEWRSGMNNIPVFVVNSPQAFQEQLLASRPDPATGKPDPARMKAFLAAHPETARAIGLIKNQSVSSGFANTTYNGLDAFRFVDRAGVSTPVRWSMVPAQPFAPEDASASSDKNSLFDTLIADAGRAPLQWHLVVTIAAPGDSTSDATVAWPDDRTHVDVGTLTVDRIEGEDSGACRDVNFDPLVLPSGIEPSDDPLLSARSAAYSQSFTRRAGEKKTPSAVQTDASRKGGQP